MKLVLLLLLILFIWLLLKISWLEGLEGMQDVRFFLDTLYKPPNTEPINEIGIRSRYRLIGIDEHVKLDRYDRINKILYSKPKPDKGETRCYRVNCPNWIENIACWKCD